MKAIELVNNDVPPIRSDEPVKKAISWMEEFKVNHLPVVENGVFQGILSEEMVLDHNDSNSLINEFSFIGKQQLVSKNAHLYRVMFMLANHKLSIVPVCDENRKFIGAISGLHLVNVLSRQTGFNQPGAIIVLQMNSLDYQMSQIAQIIESNNAKILGFYTETFEDNNQLRVTVKLNQSKMGPILQTFSRYDYNIDEVYIDDQMENEFQSRYDHLMNYLSL
jgi:CBS domain-containing protein